MGRSRLVVSVLSGAVSIVQLFFSLFLIYLTLGWKVRRARKAFERELIRVGVSKEVAKRMGARYAALKDETLNALKSRTMSFRSFSDLGDFDEFEDESRLQIFGIRF